MGLFDSYFDPDEFNSVGGLIGRLTSLQQQQEPYQSAGELNGYGDEADATAKPNLPQIAAAQITPDTPSGVKFSDDQLPQFRSQQAMQPRQAELSLGDRLDAGFQSWAHTPTGNPMAALANGITGFESGQRISQVPASRNSRAQPERPQSPSPIIQDVAPVPMRPQTANRSAARVPVGPIMPGTNPWKSRYAR